MDQKSSRYSALTKTTLAFISYSLVVSKMQTKIKLIAIQSELQRKCKRKINNTFLQEIPIQLQTKENNEFFKTLFQKTNCLFNNKNYVGYRKFAAAVVSRSSFEKL